MESWMRTIWSNFATSAVGLIVLILIFGAVLPASGLRCFRCGQYTDGPGSITPCINYTAQLHLKDCPSDLNRYCVKYVNEASTVRECAEECVEKPICPRWTISCGPCKGGFSRCSSIDDHRRLIVHVSRRVTPPAALPSPEVGSDSWGTSIYCCNEDGCNSSTWLTATLDGRLAFSLLAIFHRFLFNWSG